MTQSLLLPETRAALKAAPADALVVWCLTCGAIFVNHRKVQRGRYDDCEAADAPYSVGPPAACIAAFDAKGT